MRRLSGTTLSIRPFLALGFAQGSSPAPGSIKGDVFRKATHGELAVLPGAFLVIRGLISKKTELHAKGAFAVDGLPPGISEIEASAPGLYAALSVEVSADTSSTIPLEINLSAVTSTTSPQLTGLKAMDCAFSRKVHHD